MHKVPAHRTASLIALKIVATLQVDVVVLRLLTPFLSHHLNTNFDNTEIFHRKLVVVAVRHLQARSNFGRRY